MRTIILMVLTINIAACGSGSSSSQTPAEKPLFTSWYNSADDVALDLTGLDFGTNNVRLTMATNAWCDCQLTITGDQASGSATLFSCSWTGPGISRCVSGGVGYTYTNAQGALNLCDGDGYCSTYR